jgi:CheY-like chemotaxis protein
MSILIVEDNPVNARLLALMLHAQGYQTVVARNGKEALATVPETPDI